MRRMRRTVAAERTLSGSPRRRWQHQGGPLGAPLAMTTASRHALQQLQQLQTAASSTRYQQVWKSGRRSSYWPHCRPRARSGSGGASLIATARDASGSAKRCALGLCRQEGMGSCHVHACNIPDAERCACTAAPRTRCRCAPVRLQELLADLTASVEQLQADNARLVATLSGTPCCWHLAPPWRAASMCRAACSPVVSTAGCDRAWPGLHAPA